MRELREDTFSGNKNEDAHDHVDLVLNIVSWFNIPGVSQDTVLLRVFPFILTRSAKRWVDRLTPGAVNTWDLLKKTFIQRYCPPSKTAKRLKDVHNFKKESDESLYQAWEWYNDFLYKCLTHDINIHQKVKCKYVTRNTGKRTSNEENTDSYETLRRGLDHVNPVIRLPLEHGISRVLMKDDYSNPSIGTNPVTASII
ncbi:hypothetical protein Tco_0524027 [Tanacetum coccineum]